MLPEMETCPLRTVFSPWASADLVLEQVLEDGGRLKNRKLEPVWR